MGVRIGFGLGPISVSTRLGGRSRTNSNSQRGSGAALGSVSAFDKWVDRGIVAKDDPSESGGHQRVHAFMAQVNGKGYQVRIYDHQVEWDQPRFIEGQRKPEIDKIRVPLSQVREVSPFVDASGKSLLQISTNDSDFYFAVSEYDAKIAKLTLQPLLQAALDAPRLHADASEPARNAAPPDGAGRATMAPQLIRQLAELRDAGVLSETQFEQKKAELLARI